MNGKSNGWRKVISGKGNYIDCSGQNIFNLDKKTQRH